jgi:hypothetical protein
MVPQPMMPMLTVSPTFQFPEFEYELDITLVFLAQGT